jgi:hypothetical protein
LCLKFTALSQFVPIFCKIPPSGEEKITANVIWGKNMKKGREKAENVKEKRKKGERKGDVLDFGRPSISGSIQFIKMYS